MRPNLAYNFIVRCGSSNKAAFARDLLCHVPSLGWFLLSKRIWRNIGVALGYCTKIQLCGKLSALIDGIPVEGRLPGRQGRMLFAFLVINRNRNLTRSQLLDALWPEGQDGGLAPLLSKLRRITPVEEYGIVLPPDTWVDVEAATESVHRAESALAQGKPYDAWGPSQVAMFVTRRLFLPDEEFPWIIDTRRMLDNLHLRSLEAYGRATLDIGGTELPAAIRVGRTLIAREPYRETGYRLLMEALAREGNKAEALVTYERLRRRLRADLGVGPSAKSQELHRQLLR